MPMVINNWGITPACPRKEFGDISDIYVGIREQAIPPWIPNKKRLMIKQTGDLKLGAMTTKTEEIIVITKFNKIPFFLPSISNINFELNAPLN